MESQLLRAHYQLHVGLLHEQRVCAIETRINLLRTFRHQPFATNQANCELRFSMLKLLRIVWKPSRASALCRHAIARTDYEPFPTANVLVNRSIMTKGYLVIDHRLHT